MSVIPEEIFEKYTGYNNGNNSDICKYCHLYVAT